MTTWHVGDRALVSGPPGEVIAEVLAFAAPADLPLIDGAPPPEEVRAIMREWGVDLVLLLAHPHDGADVCFYALHYTLGDRAGWRDLHGQDLEVQRFHGAQPGRRPFRWTTIQ